MEIVKNIMINIRKETGKVIEFAMIGLGIALFLIISFQLVLRFNIFGFEIVDNNYLTQEKKLAINKFLEEDNTTKPIVSSHAVANFSLEKNALTFRNLSSDNSSGLCLGISTFEKKLFEGSLEKVKKDQVKDIQYYDISFMKDKDLSKYKMDDKTSLSVYGSSNYYNSISYLLKNNTIKGNKDIKYYFDKINTNNMDLFEKVPQANMKEILKALNYYQRYGESQFKIIKVLPYQLMDSANINQLNFERIRAKINPNLEVKANLDIKDITSRIDKNEPIILAFHNGFVGHAVVAYKYEYYSDDTLKVYVADSNIPLLDDKEEFRKLNNEVKQSTYAYFEKLDDGTWAYKYNPKINDVYFYQGSYTSFIPNTTLRIYHN